MSTEPATGDKPTDEGTENEPASEAVVRSRLLRVGAGEVRIEESSIAAVKLTVLEGTGRQRVTVDLPADRADRIRAEIAAVLEAEEPTGGGDE